MGSTVLAGTKVTVTWPVTLADDSAVLSAADIVVLRTDHRTGATAALAEDDVVVDDDASTVAATVILADDDYDNVALRLDIDNADGDLAAAEYVIFVTRATGQRPA
jgi:hypothetical protein